MGEFIAGFFLGGLIGFVMCGVVHVNRVEEIHERRIKSKKTFPITDCDGVLVHADRRREPDRRLHSITHHA